jgi:hypothetical protein
MITQSVADILSDHVRLTVEGIDRMYLNVYVSRLQMEQGIAWFFREHRGQPVPSAALMSPMSRGFVSALDRFATQHQIPVVQFRKGERKDDVMAKHLRQFSQDEGVVFIGKAQEKAPVFRTERRTNPKTGRTYPWIVRSTAMVNHYYIYALDRNSQALGYAVRASIMLLGAAARVWRILHPCFLAVETTDLRRAKI